MGPVGERGVVEVEVGARSYEVLVGPGVASELARVIPPGATRAVVVTQVGIGVEVDPGIPSDVLYIPDGEQAKSLGVVEALCGQMVRLGVHRGDVVVAVGGGVVSDVAGFAASVFHRGVAVVNVPTTLLAQVDAAIGGKTAVNLAEGKNLVGSFWQPLAVICDTETLASLPAREWRSGHGEMAKYAFLGVDQLETLPLFDQVLACVRAKAAVVSADERETGRRTTLNYGHTLAHALEASGFASDDASARTVDLRHGEAVAIGLVFAAELAHLLGRITASRVARHREVVASYDLPMQLPASATADGLIETMERDKKSTGGLDFVLDGPEGVELVRGVDRRAVKDALVAVGLGR